jgi:hypothetical protein
MLKIVVKFVWNSEHFLKESQLIHFSSSNFLETNSLSASIFYFILKFEEPMHFEFENADLLIDHLKKTRR